MFATKSWQRPCPSSSALTLEIHSSSFLRASLSRWTTLAPPRRTAASSPSTRLHLWRQRLCLDVGNPCLGISIDKLASIGDAVIDAKFGLANLTFGSGSGLIQSATRDTLKFVYKAPACYNKWVMMMSTDRSTDPGMKSNAGLLTVECHNGVFTTVAKNMEDFTANQATTIFKTYYEDGLLVSFDSLKEMCARISQDETRWIGTEKVEDNERKRKMPASL